MENVGVTFKSKTYEFSHVKGYFKIKTIFNYIRFKVYAWEKNNILNRVFKNTWHYEYLSAVPEFSGYGDNFWASKKSPEEDSIERISKIKYHCVKALEHFNTKYIEKHKLEIALKEESNIMIEALKDL